VSFSRWSINKKLTASFAAIGVVVAALGLHSQATIISLGKSEDLAINGLAKKIALAAALDQSAERMKSEARGLLLAAYSHDRALAEKSQADYRTDLANFRKALAGAVSLVDGEDEAQITRGLSTDIDAWDSEFGRLERLCEEGNTEAAEKSRVGKLAPLADDLDVLTDRLRDEQVRDLTQAGQDAEASVATSRWTGIGFLVSCLAIGVAVFLVIRRINGKLKHVAAQMFELAAQVTTAAAQVSSSSESLARGASEQAASLEETSASSGQIHSMAGRNNDNSRAAAELVKQSYQNVNAANQVLEQMVTAMGEISGSSDRIAKIIKVIDEIAFQTNILALNAAVEAARAGGAGAGFAVVADEVRNLAQRSADAAKETASLIEESIANSSEGRRTVDQVTGTIRAITEDSIKLKSLVEDISERSNQQALGIEQVGKTIVEMERVTQQNASSAEESAAASEELYAQAQSMRTAALELLSMVGGASNAA
jgi:methyl-accepting chemotaxis protein/methyl-accepting chemotaxis protein-1 (serine sensor receptor)